MSFCYIDGGKGNEEKWKQIENTYKLWPPIKYDHRDFTENLNKGLKETKKETWEENSKYNVQPVAGVGYAKEDQEALVLSKHGDKKSKCGKDRPCWSLYAIYCEKGATGGLRQGENAITLSCAGCDKDVCEKLLIFNK